LSSSLRSGKLPPVPVEEPPDDLSDGAARGAGAGAWFLIGAAVVGLGIATYLTTLHYAGVSPICTTNGFVNCGSVLKSTYSVVPGTSIPVTVPGMIWFIVSGALAVVSIRCARRGIEEPEWLRPAHLIWCLLGLVSVLYFVFAELVKLHELCEWCTGVHILVFLSLLVTIARVQPARVSSRGL
jgi:uncharacterized membrane protein